MPEREPTRVGVVRHVLGSQVTVALDADLAGVAPIYRGRLQPIGQIGSLVRFPQGLVDLIGQVSLLGISELAGAPKPAEVVQGGRTVAADPAPRRDRPVDATLSAGNRLLPRARRPRPLRNRQ